jgi:endonuclease G, mitochondrial
MEETMNFDSTIMARARFALRQATLDFMFDPNVNLMGIGYPEHRGQIAENELAIRVHVNQKLSGVALEAATEAGYTHPIPSEINGFPTDVLRGKYRLQQWQAWRGWWIPTTSRNERAISADPMRGGISISDEFHLAYGTLGGKVYDRLTGEEMILSNWHVLAGDWRARRGQLIYQPGRLDGGTFSNASAYLTRHAMEVNLDAAVATLTSRRRLINEQLGLGPVLGAKNAQLGDQLVKSGRSSYITYGRIVEINSVARMRYGYLERLIRDVMIIDPWNGGEVSRPGDSGAWWLNRATKQAVGLHFAGSDLPERALAINMPSVLDALNVEIRG